jgi:hypothetical protein
MVKVETENDIRANSSQFSVMEIKDIKRNDKCFTDGVGKISWGFAGRVAQRMKIPLYRKVC